MKTIRVHFDGRVLVPDEEVDLPVGVPLELQVRPVGENGEERPLMQLLKALEGLPVDPDSPTDRAAQHDHYLYGTPKRP